MRSGKLLSILLAGALALSIGACNIPVPTEATLEPTESTEVITVTTTTVTTAVTETAAATQTTEATTEETSVTTTEATTTTSATTSATTTASWLSEFPDSPSWVNDLPQARSAEQLFIVAVLEGTNADVTMHQKDSSGRWKQIMTTKGYIGLNGLGKTKEGDKKTPTGTFGFNAAFGIADDPGCAIPYHKVTDNDYWSGDTRNGYHYNEMVDINDYPDLNKSASEHLIDYTKAYQYCLNINYNEECIANAGSAIFLHCIGNNDYTMGCVAIPQVDMIYVMQHVDPDCLVVIDSYMMLCPD